MEADDLHSPQLAYKCLVTSGELSTGGLDSLNRLVVWSWIKGADARNHNGEPAPRPERRWVLQKKVVRPDGVTAYACFCEYVRPAQPAQVIASEGMTAEELIRRLKAGESLDDVLG